MTGALNGWMIAVLLLAGALGALARYLLQRWLPENGLSLPRAVLIVNVWGSVFAGAAIGFAEAGFLDETAAIIIVTGFCGGLTTMSTLSVETIELARLGRMQIAWANVIANVVLGVGGAIAGFWLAQGVGGLLAANVSGLFD